MVNELIMAIQNIGFMAYMSLIIVICVMFVPAILWVLSMFFVDYENWNDD